MILAGNVESLDFEVSLLEERRRRLRILFEKGGISQNTFNLLDKRISRIKSLIIDLKDALQEEREFWDLIVSEGPRVLESILADFKFLNLIGEIDAEEWEKVDETINLGIKFLSRKSPKLREDVFDNAEKPLAITKAAPLKKASPSRAQRRKEKIDRRRIDEKPASIVAAKSSDSHCMNPWKPECRRTNIKLSIYYEGRFLPICEECWKEISKRNIEWSI